MLAGLVCSRPGAGQISGAIGGIDPQRSVLTQHNDQARSGAYLQERRLSVPSVRDRGMQLVRRIAVDAAIRTQLLYVHRLPLNGRRRNVVVAATIANTVHAIDLDDGSTLWVDTLRDRDTVGRNLARPLLSTPVIDPRTFRLYVLYSTGSRSSNISTSLGPRGVDAAFWLTAIDVRTGLQQVTSRISASVPRSDGSTLSFAATNQRSRPGLLLSHGSVYVAFGPRPREEEIEYHGWVMRYDARTLLQLGVFCTSPDARAPPAGTVRVSQGAGIWQGNAGLAADSLGQVFLMSGNARAEPARGWFGNSFVKLAPGTSRGLVPAGTFSPESPDRRLERYDWDLGSGGPLLIPGTSLVAGGGKTGMVYLLDAKAMTLRQAFQAARDARHSGEGPPNTDTTWYAGPQLRGSLTWWRGPHPRFGYVYVWGAHDYLRSYRFHVGTQTFDTIAAAVGRRQTPAARGRAVIPGGMLSLSAKGLEAGTGILWAMVPAAHGRYVLAAFDAESLAELWSTPLPAASYLQPPTVGSGRVAVATVSSGSKRIPEIRIYGLGGPPR